MIRSVAAVVAALNAVAPNFPHTEAAAPYVQQLAEDGGFDAFTLIEYVDSESGWDEAAVGRQRAELYLGLGQLRLRNYDACREDLEAPPCLVVARALLNWRFNLGQTAQVFVWARGYCKEQIGSGAARWWMQVVKGWDAKRHTTCGHDHGRPLPVPTAVSKLLKRRAMLEKSVRP